ncbi:MAG: ABC transporter permease [Bacteroidales bacterium]|nr:ABC transporter permease [Bacteroidales bacterium]
MLAKTTGFNLFLLFLSGLLLLFIIAPLAGMFLSVNSEQVAATLHDKEVASSISLTLWTSMLASIIFGFGAVPLAYFLARKKFFMRSFILGIINVPVVIPHSAAGIAILGFISRDSFIGSLASSVGLNLVGNPIAIILAMAFVSLPFIINASIDAFSAVPIQLEKAALNLGASSFRVFFQISLPLAWRGILTGFIMMWARGMSEFGAVVIVAYHPMVTPVLIYERFASFGLKYATPVAVVFIVITLLFFVLMRLLSKSVKTR